MDKFPVFTALQYKPMPDLQIVGPLFGPGDHPAERYADNVGDLMGSFHEVDLRGEPQSPTAPGTT